MKNFDLTIIGSGPGGYVAAIRAAQLGLKTCLIEKESIGGVCLNKGCIPTKGLLESAYLLEKLEKAQNHGISLKVEHINFQQTHDRAFKIVSELNSGIEFLLKKNKVTIMKGSASFIDEYTVEVNKEIIKSKFFIIATGAQYRKVPGLEPNGKNILGAWEALKLIELPKSIGIIGAGAIGIEFAYLWNTFKSSITVFEREDRIIPFEDKAISQELEKILTKKGIIFHTNEKSLSITSTKNTLKIGDQPFDLILVSTGMVGYTDGLNLPLEIENSFIKTNEFYQTNFKHIYAIGDVSGPPLLAHVASYEGICAVEHIANHEVTILDKKFIPSCIYSQPQVASMGYREYEIEEKYTVGIFPFQASGKSLTADNKEGFIKVLTNDEGELLGAHIIGPNASEIIHSFNVMHYLEGTTKELCEIVFPHPTLGESIQEAFLNSLKRSIHL